MDLKNIINEFSQDDLIYVFLPIFFAALLIEWIYSRRYRPELFEIGDTKASIWMMLLVGVVDLAPKFLAFIALVYLADLSPLRDIVRRQWWAWVLLFLLDDFIYYWFHRLNHQVRLFWAGHVSHHSAIRMNFATALRQGVGERLHKYLFWLPLPLLGFDPLMILTVMAWNLFYQYWLHTELIGRLPTWFEWIFNTPSHHRVHHASNIRYLDCNHGGMLIIWDRLFGSFSKEVATEKPVYGLTTNITSLRPIDVATHEYRAILSDVHRATSWSDKLRYLFLAPGWSHDGEDKRSKVLRSKVLRSNSDSNTDEVAG
ncbi:sterol desaturase family protein [Arenicella xantha]|uniref:Sterol desaturase/sphingolipid hydroxylase (Fatty acid hydroxylase superfamily) n=1 Tax=Arenicella xantha TaxID=644221 RepID=A0A395JJU5_9GAMM|nr:sterol desaturase family protein [Arenicella xantha]RBP50685.1 sterol desaturase/sphingolipid hydroxylase (fatty acid hydroxylase superfamily) [Arenicella xantha]